MPDTYTPGPWVSMDGCGTFGDGVIQADTLSPVALPPTAPDGDNWRADARLIAAAPDLLAACEEAARMYPASPTHNLILDAIARAKGDPV